MFYLEFRDILIRVLVANISHVHDCPVPGCDVQIHG